ncbi:FHA domain-containing protein [Anaeromyxobacter sp. Red801]
MAREAACARCGRENGTAAAFCQQCGLPLRAPGPAAPEPPAARGRRCGGCGAGLDPADRFCPRCGTAAAPRPGDPHAAPTASGIAGPPPPSFRLAAVRTDGLPGAEYGVPAPEAVCGRTEGEIRIPDDPTVSPRHACFRVQGAALRVEDLGSANGTFVRIRRPHRLAVGEEIRVGRQLLRLEPLPRPPPAVHGVRSWGAPDPGCRFRLSQLLEGGGQGEVVPLLEGENAIGREAGRISFPSDRYVSARHARIDVRGDAVTLVDLGSSNGTFVRISAPTEVAPGDQLLLGAQLLRVEA